MKLLICTQAVDQNHPILGFFHRWIEEFAKHCDSVHVICLYEGMHDLPSNVLVHSLGKEKGENRFKYLFRFYMYIWKLRHEYDTVFVHMNQVYIILGSVVWRLLGKHIGLWYAHGKVSTSLRLATKFTHIVFTSTEQGFQLATPKRNIVGQGIDLEHFANKERTFDQSLLRLITVGRITQSKNIETLIEACEILKNEGVTFKFEIVGIPLSDHEREYERAMKEKVTSLNLDDCIEWVGAVSQSELPSKLLNADIFIHDGSTQSLDKALVEAVASGCIVISSNPSYSSLTQSLAPQFLFKPKDVNMLMHLIKSTDLDTGFKSMQAVQKFMRSNFSVSNLISNIISKY